jgi:KUP system potassium uptake protein
LGAIGVVFGDIGTSPLYAVSTVFSIDHGIVKPTPGDVYGVISLVFWSITLIVTIKYVVFVLRADNDGEGGILALAHLARQKVSKGWPAYRWIMLFGVIGATLFYGDSVITPAISVMSAVEGLEIASPGASEYVLPAGVVIITMLFVVQRFGTHVVGRFFGPVMVLWFGVLAVMGLRQVVIDPAIIKGLSPVYAVEFWVAHPYTAFIAMGAIVLSITGAEALYADMGHFGSRAIRMGWFAFVFPALTLNYLGQGALILRDPRAISGTFFHLAPDWAQLPLVALATLATVIASQAVISGAFSMTREAQRLGFLPRMKVMQTSQVERGQIFIPAVNWLLFAGVLALLFVFGSSERLATAYGLAVTGTLLLTTSLFLLLARTRWRWSAWALLAFGVPVYTLELLFFGANLTKIAHGGWLPLSIAAVLCLVMLTWARGYKLVSQRRRKLEGPIGPFIDWLHTDPVTKVPGTAVFLHPDAETTPLAFRENANFNHVIHEHTWIISALSEDVPHIPLAERIVVDHLQDSHDNIAHLTLRFGFRDEQDVPLSLAVARSQGVPIDLDNAMYYLSRISVHASDRPGMARWRKPLFVAMARNSASPVEFFHLPVDKVVIMGAQVLF